MGRRARASLPVPSPRPGSRALLRAAACGRRSLPGVADRGGPEGGRGVSAACSRPQTAGSRGRAGPGAGRGEGAAPGGGAPRPCWWRWRWQRLQLRRRARGPRPGRPRVGAAGGAMYRSGSRPSVSSHRPKDGGPRSSRSSGSSSGSVRRTSPPPLSSSFRRTPTRRPRSPSGHRGRRASPSPPRGRRGSPSPPRARRGSPSPPRGRRLFPAGSSGYRGSSRGESRADFARDGRGDHSGDSGSRVIPRRGPSPPSPVLSAGVPASTNAPSGPPGPGPGWKPRLSPPSPSVAPVCPGASFSTITEWGPLGRQDGRQRPAS